MIIFFFFLFFLIIPYAFFKASDFFFLLMDPFRHLVGLLGREISPAPRPLPTQDNIRQRNTDTSMPRARFETAIPVFERPKTVLALDRAAIGYEYLNGKEAWEVRCRTKDSVKIDLT
jgi:hypothetical protein